jgi:uncharacterized protein YndB with AHSA1/START domain
MTATAHNMATTQIHRIYIKTTPEKVWEAITNPDWTEKYGYGGRAILDLRPGGKFIHETNPAMRAQGAPDVAVDGEVIESDPPRKLVLNWRMAMDPASFAEGFTRLTYDIVSGGPGVTRLTVTHELEGAPKLSLLVSGSLEEHGAGGGWSWILSGLKTLLETGAELDTH